MYSTLLSKESNEFINDIFSNASSKTPEVSFSIAYALANKLVLPTSKVDNVIEFYNQNSKNSVNLFLSIINEIILLDLDVVNELIVNVYQLRYDAVFGRDNVLAMKPETAVEDLFGISKYINKDIISAIKANPLLITKCVNKFHKVFCELSTDSITQTSEGV